MFDFICKECNNLIEIAEAIPPACSICGYTMVRIDDMPYKETDV